MSKRGGSSLSTVIIQGVQLQALLEQGALAEAERLAEHYLQSIEEVFEPFQRGETLNVEQQQLLLQFQVLHDWVSQEKQQAEAQLREFSQAGRASGLYKLNAG